jgi:ketosteroid isomerase-like protein
MDDVVEAADAFQRALEARDVDAVEPLLHEDYALMLLQPARAVMPRERWLEVLPEYRIHEYRIEERIVDRVGDTAAILQRASMRATVLGEDRSGVLIISDVWRHDGGWRLWRRHSTPLTAGTMPGA